MARIELRNIQKFFGAVQVLKDVNLTIEDGEFIAVMARPEQLAQRPAAVLLRRIRCAQDDHWGRRLGLGQLIEQLAAIPIE